MKNLSTYGYLTLLTAFLLVSTYAYSQKTDPSKWEKATADKWVKSRVYAPGLKPVVDPSVNSREFARQYALNKAEWDKAFEFLMRPDLASLAPGKYPIVGDDVFATISDDPLKELPQSNFEDHHNYIDLHYVIDGAEKIGYAPFSSMTSVVTPFDDAKDIGYYQFNSGTYYTATPSNFFLFFPADAHRPHLKLDGYTKAKKLVIKIKVVK